jgi:DNA-3-methyladenine glycosylase I
LGAGEADISDVAQAFRLYYRDSRYERHGPSMTSKTADDKPRCSWAQGDPLMRRYHDEEWGVPQHDGRALWELLMLEGFQAGLAWITVLRKREAFRSAFRNFDPTKVARFRDKDIARLMSDSGIIRSRAKIDATIKGAQIFLEMSRTKEDFAATIWTLAGGTPIQNRGPVPALTPLSTDISRELKKRGFKFVGPTIVYAFMQAAGIVNDHSEACFRRKVVAKL